MTQLFSVPSVSCQHCVNSISKSVGDVPGVKHVNVDLATKQVTVATESPVPTETLLAAINEAGYEDATVVSSAG
ncbi:MAG: heavy metal-associated domain-containing protein [Herpetosiphon sp.]